LSLLSPTAIRLLQEMAAVPDDIADDEDDGTLLVEGIQVWFGDRRVHRRTFNKLLHATAVSPLYDNAPYYQINETGRAIARRPELADEVYAAIIGGRGAFSIVDGHIVPLTDLKTRPRGDASTTNQGDTPT
jgi:hypothetical protein